MPLLPRGLPALLQRELDREADCGLDCPHTLLALVLHSEISLRMEQPEPQRDGKEDGGRLERGPSGRGGGRARDLRCAGASVMHHESQASSLRSLGPQTMD